MPTMSSCAATHQLDLTVLGVVALGIAVGAAATAQTPPAPVTRGGAFINISIPMPIGGEELERYANTLKLDDGQRVVLQMLYGEYLEEEAKFREAEIKKLWDHSASIAARGDLGSNLQTGDEFAALMRARQGTVRRLASIDERLFSQLTSYLAEWQEPPLEQVRHQRIRVRCNAARSEYPGGTLDLAVLLHELQQVGALEVLDRDTYGEILFEYDIRVTPLFERRYRAKLKVMAEGPRILAAASTGGDGEMTDQAVWAKRQQALEERQRLRARHVHAAKQIRELNEQYLGRVSDILEKRSIRLLKERYLSAVYPTVYPDPNDIGALFERVLRLETLTETQRDGIKALEATYSPRQRHLSEMMVGHYLSWREEAAERGWQHPDAVQEYQDEMDRLGARRLDNATSTKSQIKGILSPAQLAQIDEDRRAPATKEQ
jgi:hypothetical protein